MTINCVIVEDEPLARKLLESYVENTPGLALQKSMGNPLEALEYLREHKTDVLFSDIQMKEITGITLLKLLKNKPLVVFTTAYSEYALEGYELEVLDYLLKPITFERFLKAVEKVTARLKETTPSPIIVNQENANEAIFLKDGGKLIQTKFKDILYIQGLKDYVKVTTTNKVIVALQTMKSLEDILPKNQFIRIHNSTIVSLNAIEEIEKDKVKILDQYFPISEGYKKDFKAFIDENKI